MTSTNLSVKEAKAAASGRRMRRDSSIGLLFLSKRGEENEKEGVKTKSRQNDFDPRDCYDTKEGEIRELGGRNITLYITLWLGPFWFHR